MKNKLKLLSSIVQIVIGLLAIISFVIVALSGEENMLKWIVTLILAGAFVIIGIIGIMDYKNK